MSPIGIARYIFFSAVLVISLFLSLRLLFAHDMRREAWRSVAKRHFYMGRKRFKAATLLLGWILLFVALTVAYWQIDELITNQG